MTGNKEISMRTAVEELLSYIVEKTLVWYVRLIEYTLYVRRASENMLVKGITERSPRGKNKKYGPLKRSWEGEVGKSMECRSRRLDCGRTTGGNG